MIFIVPIVPIVIAVFLIAGGLFGEFQTNIDSINTFLMVVVVIIFVGIAIYNLTRDYVSSTKKVFSTISCAVLGTVSGYVIRYFLSALAAIDMDPLGVIEFAIVFFIGGSIALLIILGCIMACAWFSD